MSLDGKVALVTGAARRVGRTIALAFAASHHHVPGAPTPSFGWRSGREKASQ